MFQHSINLSIFVLLVNLTTFCSAEYSFWLPQKPTLRFHNNEPIKLKPGAYEALVARWEKRLTKSWEKFYQNLNSEVGLSPAQLDTYVHDETLASIYSSLKEKELLKIPGCLDENSIDPDVLTFIKRVVQKYCTKKNIKIIITPNINTITATFGSDKNTHYLICHASIYSPEHIKHFYDSLANNNGAFYIEPSSNNSVRFIELSNFLLVGLIEAASHIQHESNLLTFLVSNFKFSEQRPTDFTIQSCWHITEIRGIIESILQSKNPLETAIFIGKTRKRNTKEQSLWKKLVSELAACYEQESLELFKASIQEIKSLYKS